MVSSVLLPVLVALAALSETVSAIRNITTPPVIIPLTFAYNTTFSPQYPGRFLAPISIGTAPQTFQLALDISRPDIEIRHDFPGFAETQQFRNLLFKNSSSDSFFWGTPGNDVNSWLGPGPTDNITLGNLAGFQTGWNRWNHTETINLSRQQREEMLAYGISGTLGVHGPACAVDGGSWFTSLVADGGAPFRTWGMYFSGGFGSADANNRITFLDGDTPDYTAILMLGGYQPSKFTGSLTMVGNITYNNASPIPLSSTSLPRDPHLLRLDSISINTARAVVPTREESLFLLSPQSIFSNFTTRAQASLFAAALNATAESLPNSRTQYTFPDCSSPSPTQNVELIFPTFPLGAPRQRIALPPSSLKILKDGICYLSFQEPWDPVPVPTDQQTPPTNSGQLPRGTLGISFLRNVYIHTDYDASAYFLAPRSTTYPTSSTANSVYPIPNPPRFVLDQCWNKEGTPMSGEYEESWYRFPAAFMEYYAPSVGPPWVYRIRKSSGVATVLALIVIPVGLVVCFVLAWVNKKVGHTITGKPGLGAPGGDLKGKI